MSETSRRIGKKLMNGEHARQTTVTAIVTAILTAGTIFGGSFAIPPRTVPVNLGSELEAFFRENPIRMDPATGTELTDLRRELETKIFMALAIPRDDIKELKDEIRELKRDIRELLARLRELEGRSWPE